MALFRLSFVSLMTCVATLIPCATMAQSTLPTTGYNMRGVAETLATSEENGIAGRLQMLREGDRLATRRIINTPRVAPFTELQPSKEILHDLRPQNQTTTHKTTNSYKLYNPAVYRDPIPPTPADTWIEREYDELMRKTSIGGGAANATTRNTQTVRQRIVPNMADRVAKDIMDWTAEMGGAGKTFDSTANGLPRYTLKTLSERQKEASRLYRGQPLSTVAKYEENAPIVFDEKTLPPADARLPSAAAQDTMRFRQNPHYAIAKEPSTAPLATKNMTLPPRKTTDAGSYIWTSEPEGNTRSEPTSSLPPTNEVASAPSTPQEEPLLAQEPITTPTINEPYGATASQFTAPIDSNRRWGAFISGVTGYGYEKHLDNSAKAKTVRSGFTAGVDFRLHSSNYVGLALTYVHSSFTTGSIGDLRGNSTALSLYGTADYANNAYVDGYLSLGYHALDSERTILAGTNPKAKADPDGFQFTGKVETGYDFRYASLKYGPFAGMRLAYATFGSYSETGAGANNLKVDDVDDLSAIASLGLGASHPFIMANGGTFLPSMRLTYNHEFGDSRSDVDAAFADGSGTLLTPSGAKKSRDWITLAPAMTAALPNNWTFQLQYQRDFFRDDSGENIFNLAANYKW